MLIHAKERERENVQRWHSATPSVNALRQNLDGMATTRRLCSTPPTVARVLERPHSEHSETAGAGTSAEQNNFAACFGESQPNFQTDY